MAHRKKSNAEVSANWLTPVEQDAWKALASILLLLPGRLEAQLQRDAGIKLFDYFVLSIVSMTEGRTMRMSELAELANGSLTRLSNVVKRLEDKEWMRREPDPHDGRYTNAVLTDAGFDLVVAAAPGHVEAVRRLVLDPLTATQIDSMRTIGQTIVTGIRPGFGE